MSLSTIKIVRVDPYHKVYGLLVPQLAQRMLEATDAMGDTDGFGASQFMAELWSRSPNTLLLAALDPSGGIKSLKGFCAATRVGPQVFMLQPKLDEPAENDAISEMIEAVSDWALSVDVKQITLIARRADPKWLKKHKFVVERYIMIKDLTDETA